MTQAIPVKGVLTPVDTAIQEAIDRARIVIAPAKVLSEPSHEILYTPLIQNLYDAMCVMMIANNGIGLAAPQIGLPIRFIIVKDDDGVIRGMLNPDILGYSKDSVTDNEGCLSVPGHRVPVPRHSEIFVNYTPIDCNEIKSEKFTGLVARCIQHEVDHLDGITLLESKLINRHKRRIIESDLKKLKAKVRR